MTLDSNGLALGCDRRTFLKSSAALAGLALWPVSTFGSASAAFNLSPRKKKPGLIRGAFFYPPADLVLAGKNEDGWSKHEVSRRVEEGAANQGGLLLAGSKAEGSGCGSKTGEGPKRGAGQRGGGLQEGSAIAAEIETSAVESHGPSIVP